MKNSEMNLLVIVGPTGVGKSALGLGLANIFGSEIVSADSRQVYRYMDIGTAKPSREELSLVPHHLIDVVDPDQDYSVALFLSQARKALFDIKESSKMPILVGGTGQYIWALLEGWQVPKVPPDPELRRRLEEKARVDGPAQLYRELKKLSPEAAERIDSRNVRRVIRALERRYASPSEKFFMSEKVPPPYNVRILGLTLQRSELYRRIDERVDIMIERGWIDEVRDLLGRGYSPELPALSSLGYTQLTGYLRQELALEEAITQIKYRTHRFTRQQYAWFKPGDQRIHWLDASYGPGEAEREVRKWLGGNWLDGLSKNG